MRRRVELIYGFDERSGGVYPFFLRNRRHPAVQTGLARFEQALAGLIERALEGWAGAASTAVVIAALVDVPFYSSLTRGGLTTAQAAEPASELAVAALTRPY